MTVSNRSLYHWAFVKNRGSCHGLEYFLIPLITKLFNFHFYFLFEIWKLILLWNKVYRHILIEFFFIHVVCVEVNVSEYFICCVYLHFSLKKRFFKISYDIFVGGVTFGLILSSLSLSLLMNEWMNESLYLLRVAHLAKQLIYHEALKWLFELCGVYREASPNA